MMTRGLDHLNRFLVVIAVLLFFLVLLFLRQPYALGVSSARNTVETPLRSPNSTPGEVALAPSGTSAATPAPPADDASDSASGNALSPSGRTPPPTSRGLPTESRRNPRHPRTTPVPP